MRIGSDRLRGNNGLHNKMQASLSGKKRKMDNILNVRNSVIQRVFMGIRGGKKSPKAIVYILSEMLSLLTSFCVLFFLLGHLKKGREIVIGAHPIV